MTGARTDLSLYRRLLGQARPCWLHIAGILVLGLLASPLALLTPLPLKIAVDSVIGSHPVPDFLDWLLPSAATRSKSTTLFVTAGLVVAIGVVAGLRSLATGMLQIYTGERLVLDFRARLFRHVQRLSLSYHDARGPTDPTYRIQYDAPSIQWILIDGAPPVVTSVVTLVGMMYVAARFDWQLALVALTVSPVLGVLAKAVRKRLRSGWEKIKDDQSCAMSVVQETLAAVRVVKAFGQEERQHERFIHHASQGMWGYVRLSFFGGGFDLLIGLAIAIGTAAVLVIGVLHVQSGALTLGGLVLVMAYLSQLYGPLEIVTRKVGEVQSSLASAARAFALLDEAPDVTERPDACRISRATGAVAFRNVSFAYGHGHRVLDDITFEIGPGTRLGIMGATGAGKTTLVNLLTRFYDPTCGRIVLDGVDLRDYRLADLRNQFAIVLQEPVLFSASIAENIAYARPDAGERGIIAAAKAANAHEFIVRLPRGYETQVGERGMRLSGGERQRISLARAFLKEAPVLILDEPTSAVDTQTEAEILDAMERLMKGRSTFLITHRTSALRTCNLVLVIENGRLAALAPAAAANDVLLYAARAGAQ